MCQYKHIIEYGYILDDGNDLFCVYAHYKINKLCSR